MKQPGERNAGFGVELAVVPDREFRVVRPVVTFNPLGKTPRVVPSGQSPQAVRIFRHGHPTVVLPLMTTREYLLGRSEKADFYFDDETVSRQHGLLFYSEEACAWTFKDTGS